jgi:hypothetical protein
MPSRSAALNSSNASAHLERCTADRARASRSLAGGLGRAAMLDTIDCVALGVWSEPASVRFVSKNTLMTDPGTADLFPPPSCALRDQLETV